VNIGKSSSTKCIESFGRIASDGVQEVLLVASVPDLSEIMKNQVNIELCSRETEPLIRFRTTRTRAPEPVEFMHCGTLVLTTGEQPLEILLADLHRPAYAASRLWMGITA